MDDKPRDHAELLMLDFAIRTGIGSDQFPSKRYLWTDAFAVFNFLSLYRFTSDEKHLRHARRLIDLVHETLGRHHPDDTREGWISGLGEEEGRAHPTRAGLRIGKPLVERTPDDPYEMRLEWERDGQYFHYLTKWMHALQCMHRVTQEQRYLTWAVELAQAAASGFLRETPSGQPYLCWKMSIDLTRPLVSSMGQLDPLDGYCSYEQLLTDAADPESVADLRLAADQMRSMCRDMTWLTDDELGIGGTLTSAADLVSLLASGALSQDELSERVLDDGARSLERYEKNNALGRNAESRLAFRELGMAIGLRSVGPLTERINQRRDRFREPDLLLSRVERIKSNLELADRILRFWVDETNQSARTWTEHHDINEVMLATAMIDGDELLYSPAQIEMKTTAHQMTQRRE